MSDRPATEALSTRIGYHFADPELLVQALTHRSWCAEHGSESNERLEFLGDSVLGLVVTDHIYGAYPDMPEGELAKLRAVVVSAVSLADIARDLELGDALRLGKGEESSGGRDKSSILADALEGVLGAVYIDGGWEPANRLVLDLFAGSIEAAAHRPGTGDFKTRLQERVARHHDALPAYTVRGEGPDHEKHFYATVTIGGRVLGQGEGRSKKEAEQAAAGEAWEHLEQEVAGALAAAPGRTDNTPAEALP